MITKQRLTRIEEFLKPAPSFFRVDENGWNVLGGGKGASGVLHCPPILSTAEWIQAGEKG